MEGKGDLFGRLATVLAKIESVPKRGRNTHFNYDYVLEADLSEHIRPLLAEAGIALIFGVKSVETVLVDGGRPITRVECQVTLGCEGCDPFTTTVFGDGQDSGIKGSIRLTREPLNFG